MSAIRLDPRNSTAHHPLSAALLCASLAVAATAGLTLVAPTVWTAVENGLLAPQPSLAACATIPIGAERLACFDQLGKQSLQQPAKGASAPLNSL